MKRILVGLVALAATMNVAVAQVYPTELPGDPRGSAAPPVPTTRMPLTMPSSSPANPGDEPFDPSDARDEALPPVIASPFVTPPVSLEQPLDPDTYVCGAGDALELNFWGQQNLRLALKVDLEGRAFIPKVGYVAVAGKTLTAVRVAMKQKVRGNYPGLSFDLTIETPRTFLVHVVENVKHPGPFPAHAVDRVSTVLAKAGVIKEASRRRIAVHHRTGPDSVADLVQYELTGETKFNPYLLDGDVVRVPFPLTMARITGAVRRPGAYEVTASKDLAELLQLAGGLAPNAAKEPIRIVRRNAQQQDTYVDVPVGGNAPLVDDDRVIVRGTEDLQRTVLLIGAVVGSDPLDSATTSRRLPFVEGDTVWSLIDRAGGIKAPGDLRRSYISRPKSGGGQELVSIDLDALLVRRDFKADKPIGMGDTIVIPPMQYSVMVEGAVGRAGLYNYNPVFGVPEYIAHAGGMTRTARDLDEVTLIEANGSTKPYRSGMKLQPGDAILVPERNYSRAEVSQLILAGAGLLLSGVAIVLAARAMSDAESPDLVVVLARRWKTLAVAAVLGAAIAVAYALLATEWYAATLTVVPSQRSQDIAAMSLAAKLPGLESFSTDVQRIQAVLASNSVADEVIAKFDLQSHYGTPHLEQAREALHNHCGIGVDRRSSVVWLTCEDPEPQRAMDMARSFGEIGNKVFGRVSVSSAREERIFLERQVEKTRHDVDEASRKLREFQEAHKVIDLPEQSKAVISAMAQIKGEMVSKQIELSYLSGFSGRGESNVVQLQQQIAVMDGKLRQMEEAHATEPTGSGAGSGSGSASFFPNAMNVPQLRFELEQLMREQKIQETVFGLMTQRFEMARVDEARDTSSFQILDSPTLPTFRSRPRRRQIVMAGVGLGLALGAAWILIPLWWRRRVVQ